MDIPKIVQYFLKSHFHLSLKCLFVCIQLMCHPYSGVALYNDALGVEEDIW